MTTARLPVQSSRTPVDDRQRLFIRMWAVAALVHVSVNSTQGRLWPEATWDGVALAFVAAAAVASVIYPRIPPWLMLNGVIIVSAILEVPRLGNHWLLAAAVGGAAILAGGQWGGFEPAARIILLVFYSTAAFAKLNSSFFDPSVSCALAYANQTLEPWGLRSIHPMSALGTVLPYVVAGIELAIPVLLLIRPTRRVAVVLAISFHGTISLDVGQNFYDFTSVLLALFLLFLPVEWSAWVTSRVDRLLSPTLRAGLGTAGLTLGVLVVLDAVAPGVLPIRDALIFMPFLLWLPYMLTVALAATLGPGHGSPLSWRPARLTWLVIALMVLNAVTPYAEIKTAFSHNMYANLHVSGGASNHLVVRSTAPLRDESGRLVAIDRTEDPGLSQYVGSGWLLPWPSFQVYLNDHPGSVVEYRDWVMPDGTGGTIRTAEHGQVQEPPAWWRWVPLRSVDSQEEARCQMNWLPAL